MSDDFAQWNSEARFFNRLELFSVKKSFSLFNYQHRSFIYINLEIVSKFYKQYLYFT